MPQTIECTVTESDAGARADRFLGAQIPDRTRSFLSHSFASGAVLKNGKPVDKGERLRAGDRLTVTIDDPTESAVLPQNIPLEIVYEDDDLLVVNKPKGMVVHPAAGNPDGTLVNALLYHCKGSLSGIGGVIRPGIVHRIDKDTSGLLIVAKNDPTHLALAEQIQAHRFTRQYEAVVYGRVGADSGRLDAPIGRSRQDRKKMCVTDQNAKPAVTRFEVLCRYAQFTHLRLTLETGRTHQIRVHMASMGHPVAGDPLYGPKKVIRSLNGQCLHAKTIGFIHPTTQESMQFDSNLPDYFTSFLKSLR